jgi:hypothetical protein
MRSDYLPAPLEQYFKNGSIEDVVRESEGSDEPIDIKNARLIGLVAAMTDKALCESSTLQKWQLASHMGMLNAISAALSAGLAVSEDSLRMAMAFHQEYSDNAAVSDDPYVSPGADPVILAIKHTMSGYGSMDVGRDEKGVEKYVSYYTYDIDRVLYDLPLTPEALASYEEDKEARHMVNIYEYIVTQVEATRSAVLDREDELKEHLEQVYERVTEVEVAYEARIEARGVQEELPGLGSMDDEPIYAR